jgi:LPS-assembly protein
MAAVLSGGQAGAANSQPWEVTADRISHFKNPDCLVAEGNVVMTRKDGTVSGVEPSGEAGSTLAKPLVITGDWLRLEKGNMVKVRGHAVLDSAEEHITADSVRLDLDNHSGVLQHATLFFPNRHIYLVGEEVEKTGELTYHLEDGWVTKCDPQDGTAPPWSFGWSKAYITQEGFAHFMNATLRVKDVPVIYSPYFGFSTNQHRKTGLLLPEFSQGGSDGAGILVPLFINLSPSQDITLYGGGYTKRGSRGGAEYRYVLDENSKGALAVNYLQDRHEDTLDDNYKSDGYLRTREKRYWLRGKADHDFGMWQGKLDLDLVSDPDYLEEYDGGMLGFVKSDQNFNRQFNRGFESKTTYIRSNTAQVSKSWTNMSLNGELRVVDDVTATRSTHHLWSLPKLTFAGSQAILRPSLNSTGLRSFAENTDLVWDTEFVDYWREAGVGAQRLDLHPQLKAPLHISPYLETTATVGVRETFYNVDDNSDTSAGYGSGILNRYLYDFNIATSTIFMRDFKLLQNSRRLTHMIRPNLSYTYVPYKRQTYLPSMDGVDRIGAQNTIGYGLDNDFDIAGMGGHSDIASRKLAYTKFKQSYNIREAQRDLSGPDDHRRPFSDIAIEAGAYPLDSLSLIYKTKWNVYGRGILNYELTSSYSNEDGDALGLEYRYYPSLAINQVNVNLTKKITENMLTQAIFNHSLATDETSEASLRIFYNPACWAMEMLASTATNEDYRFTVLFSLEGVGNIVGLNQAFTH